MAQKTNAISLRVSNKITWSSMWSEDNKTYYYPLFKDLEIRKSFKLLTSFLGVKMNELLIKPQNGSVTINAKRIAQLIKKDSIRVSFKRLVFLKDLAINAHQMGNVLKYKKKVSLWESKMLFWYIPAAFFSEYISLQIKLSLGRRNEVFKLGIQGGIQTMLRYYFNSRRKLFVSGIKVICKGKWTKTNTGRTQKMIFNLGRLNNQVSDSFLDSSISTVTTKFGVCSVKVVISYKNASGRF